MKIQDLKVGDVFVYNAENTNTFTKGDEYEVLKINTIDEEVSISRFKGVTHRIFFSLFKDNFSLLTSNVNHPSHYGGDTPYEVIKVLEAWGFDKNAYRFNAIKYLARGDKKENLKQDLEKAIWYIQREIEMLS